ncbi:MAG: GPO family capsid scaffolding protein [Candidatus Sedimenticola sp. (ex Thyasira tokunagai)]
MMKSKFFKVAQEGVTTDGRKITRDQITQMAANYNPDTYGARMWLEHIRGFFPDSAFKAMGDVLALETKEEDGKMGLYAQISPTPDLVAMNRNRQKIYSSIEMDPSFSDTGEAYLVGLAPTDSPASLGTEAMAFSAKAEVSLFADRKERPENVITAAIETSMEFSEEADDDEDEEKPTLLSKVKAIFSKQKGDNDKRFADSAAAVLAIAESQQQALDNFTTLQTAHTDLLEKFATLQTAHDELNTQFTALAENLDEEPNPNHHSRQPASGGDGVELTDC